MARLIVTTNERDLDSIIEQVKKITGISDVGKNQDNVNQIVVNLDMHLKSQQVGEIVDELESWSNVENVAMVYAKESSFIHLFFDIDGTLTTDKGQLCVDAQVQGTFDEYERFIPNAYKYFATGRDEGTVRELMKQLKVEPFAIVENGGIVIGDYPDGRKVLGEKTEPNKFWDFLINKKPYAKIDDAQRNRRTEIVITNAVSYDDLLQIQQQASESKGINVTLLRGGRTCHITKEGVNKGTALDWLRGNRGWGEFDVIVSVGDSELDIPMFQKSHKSYLRGSAHPEIRSAVNTVPNCKPLSGKTLVEDLREILDDFGKTR